MEGRVDAAWWEVVEDAGVVVVAVRGEIDIAAEEPLVAEVERHLEASTQPVRVDLSDVEFIDSAGVRMLLRLRHRHGHRVEVGEMSAAVARVLSISGVDGVLGSDPPSNGAGEG